MLSRVQLFATPETAACQASLYITNSRSLVSYIHQTHVHWVGDAITSSSVVPFSSCLQSFPASGSFQMSQLFASGGQSIGVSASASVFPRNIQDWFPLRLTGWISLQSKGPSRVFYTTVQKLQSSALSFLYSPTLISIHVYCKNHSFGYMDFCHKVVSLFLICYISWS